MSTLALFLPLAKVDVDTRTVHGTVTAERPDRAGEICDYASTKPYFAAWSREAREASGGKSLGAVRAMHGRVAAGKLTDIAFDDEGKRILVAAKIVDDDEWAKVLEGVYTGFSQGGRYVKRWPDPDGELTRYTAEPTEISLVDLPCLPGATFDVVTDGHIEKRAFAAAPNADAKTSPRKALSKAARALKNAARKLAAAADENAALRRSFDDLRPELAALAKRIAAIEAKPLPARAALRAVPRVADMVLAEDAEDAAAKRLAAMTPEERALALTKVSLANPVVGRM